MKQGVLLVQLGTPDEPSTPAVRRYLRDFLSDPRVVDLNPWLWKPILYGIILRVRPRRSAALYRNVWTERGSPLLFHTADQAKGLAERLGPSVPVAYGMRIGNPGLAGAMQSLLDQGCQRVVVLPLFPQYSSATTASVFDALGDWVKERRDFPELRFVRSFATAPGFIAATAARVRDAGVAPSAEAPLLMSFHGLPQRFADEGDPYPQECEATAMALAEALELPEDAWQLTYQSRFGRETWLQPYTDDVLAGLPGRGVESVAVMTPSFVADCLETIDEIGRESREVFEGAGGTQYTRIECMNASPLAIDALEAIVRAQL